MLFGSSFLTLAAYYFFFFLYFTSLKIFVGLAALGLSCSMQDLLLRCTDSLVVAHRLQSTGSAVAVHGLRSSESSGLLVSQPGFIPTSPAIQGRLLTTGTPGKSPLFPIMLSIANVLLYHKSYSSSSQKINLPLILPRK